MLHIYEIDSGRGEIYYDVFQQHPYKAWQDDYTCTLENKAELDIYLHECRKQELDFIIHTLEEYDAVV